MAAKDFYRQGFLLLLFYFTSAAALDKRFSDFKRCSDQECSMLLCRGKAVKDFSGPDCRFLSFKKSETIYVYYKLSGIRADLWAGSVGNSFGYFPKDLLAVNHLYTDKEIEVPAEETDFVCFDTGFDKFDNYNIDLLLSSTVEENDSENERTSEQIQVPEDSSKETPTSSTEDATDSENPVELDDKPEDLGKVPEDPSSSLPKIDMTSEPPPKKVVDTAANLDTTDKAAEDLEIEERNTAHSVPESVVPERSKTKDTHTKSEVESVPEDSKKKEEEYEAVSVTEGVPIPELKTTLGTTFDAVTTDEDITKKVTPYEEEESKDVESHPEDDIDVREETPLLSFSKESVNHLLSDTIKQQEIPPVTPNEKPDAADEKNMWTSLGDAVFSVVTGVETTAHDLSSEEDDEEEEEEEAVAKLHSSFEEAKKYVEEPPSTEPPKEPENTDQVLQDPAESSSVQSDNKETVSDSEELILDHEDESDGDVIEHEKDLDQTLQAIDETDIQIESNVEIVDPVSQDYILANPEVEKSDGERTHETPSEDNDEEKGTNDSEINEDIADIQESSVAVDHREELHKSLDEYKIVTDQESTTTESETDQDSEKMQSYNLVKDEAKMVDDSLPSQIHDSSVKDEAKTVDASLPSQIHDSSVKDEAKTVDASLPSQIHDSSVKDEAKTVDDSLPSQIHDSSVKDEAKTVDASLPSQIHDSSVKDEAKTVDASLPSQIHDSSVNDEEKMVDASLPSQIHDSSVKNEAKMEDASLPSQIHDSSVKDEEKMVDASFASQIHDSSVKDEAKTVDASLPSQMHDSSVKDEAKTVDASFPSQIHDSSVKDEAKMVDASLPTPVHDSLVKDEEKKIGVSPPSHIHDSLMTDVGSNNIQPELIVEESEIHDELYIEEQEDENNTEMEDDKNEEKEELLEDENALSFSLSNNTDSDNPTPETEALSTASTPEPEYSDSVMRLTLLRDHFTEEQMQRFQKLLGLKNLITVEAMFSDLDTELEATHLAHTGTTQDIENALESILESSENTILDEIEKMLDNRDSKHNDDHQMDLSSFDEEGEILDDFQELAFSLRHKYSPVSDSTPLAAEKASDIDQDDQKLNVKEDMPPVVEEDKVANITESESHDNFTVTDNEERPADTEEEKMLLDKVHTKPDISVEEDGGHFNKNKDNRPGFSESDEMQKVPQATLENSLDLGLGVEVENSPSGSLDSMEPVSEIHEEEVGAFSTAVVLMSGFLSMSKNKIEEWTIVMISLLPEEWKPGETLFGCPWQAVVITALVGIVTFTLFIWRTVLAVKKREYLVDERKLTEQIQALKKEKNDVMEKMSELQKRTEQLKENQKQSKEAVSCTLKKVQDLESKVLEAKTQNELMVEEKNTYIKLLEEERANSLQNQTRIEKLEKANEKLQLNRKKIQEALAKTTVLLDEAKIREDARNVNQKSLQKDYSALKEENKTLKATIKDWEDKHVELSEQIKVYHKSQKELEDSLVLKDHNVEVLSELLADLDACDLQKGDTKVLANGEVAPDKKTVIKNRIKQMMDVSRVQTTLTVVEEERDRFMTKLLNEEKARKSMEEQHQELEHAIATLKSEKSHVENQLKILLQKNEIMVEMYQQKENALQQRLTKEELERRSKENLLSEVGGKALEAEEQVKVLRQRINEMEEQMKKTEEVYKEQIKEQENKTHSNWVNARNAERALNQEKLESSKLREKLAVLTSQLNDRRAPLFRPNSGQPSGPRQGDSYGPSPVSGGAPSPPLMIEGPRRPPSAPVGRRIDPYGPRPPSDPHGRYPENKHISGMDMMGPRSSSPANMDGSTQAVDPQNKAETQAEASTESPEPGPGSFLASPIRDSPGPMVQGPPPGSGHHDPLLPSGPLGRLPPPGIYRPPRPGFYHLPPGPHGPPPNVPPPLHGPPLPANGHPGMPLPGLMGGEFGPRPANGHTFLPRPGPGPIIDPRGPVPPHFRPPLPHHLGLIPPPSGVRGPIGPRPPIPPDMRFPGPHDHTSPPMDMPPGVPPHSADAYGQVPPEAPHNAAGAHSGPGQDLHMKQEAPQDSARPAMVKP